MGTAERTETQVLSHAEVDRKIARIAHQLHEENYREKEIVFVGIAPRGAQLAKRISDRLEQANAFGIRFIEMRLDKDDPLSVPPSMTDEVESLSNSVVVLVDDVLQSGRTLMHAAAHLVQVPLKKLTTVVLVDRRHRSFPIRADIVGITLSTTLQEHITVKLGKRDSVHLD